MESVRTVEEVAADPRFSGLLLLLNRLAQGDSIAEIEDDSDLAEIVEDYGLGHAEDLLDALNTVVLETTVLRKGTLSDAGDIQTISLVLGTGGPHDQINLSSNGSAEHEHVEWFRGEGTFERYVGTYEALADYLYDLAEELAAQR